MNQDDAKAFVSLAEYVLKQAEMQAMTTKMFFGWLDGLETRLHLQRRLAALPDCEEKQSIASQLDAIETGAAEHRAVMRQPTQAALARLESDHELLEHYLAVLRASLSKPPS